MLLIEISAAQGPQECELAVVKAWRRLLAEAAALNVQVQLIQQMPGSQHGTCLSVLLALEGEQSAPLARQWQGTVQWTCQSPYRPKHPRKNWFIGVAAYEETAQSASQDIRFEACRASGPGGQHVNKTDSAIRATHIASGISVKVQTERSQHANKRLAVLLIHKKLKELDAQQRDARNAARRQFHHEVERGNPRRIFKGERFEPVASS
ncbi:peptide chain release factor H [uncultured Aquitalea sp.]|uniref:peptide chain release factor H n=1 Tax=uncultured Aquitalea sp. TaxID=540272 RepID=UPI0025D61C06|nr:peptide chain release factor H [uncultured Aquitalea sp.]